MIINKKPWKTVETPDKLQLLTRNISEIHDYLLTTNEYKQQMELVIEIISEMCAQLTPVIEIGDVLGLEQLNRKPSRES